MTKKTTNSTIQKQIVSKYPDIQVIRHSLAHIMALAIKRLYKDVSFGIGPETDNGFYYDVITKKPITEDDLVKIEDEIKKIIKEELNFTKQEIKINEAIKLFTELNQKFKVELLNDLKNYGTTDQNEIILVKDKKQKKGAKVSTVNIYILGNIKKDVTIKELIKNNSIFIDLCRGPHIKNSKDINVDSFKINKVAGAY